MKREGAAQDQNRASGIEREGSRDVKLTGTRVPFPADPAGRLDVPRL